jgi:DNA polymerase I-like protein with 3'-5' exonuclease and polymerase domains
MRTLVRSCVLARPGRRIVEIDYSGLEVRIAACYHKDPTMQRYIEDPTTDMHRDMAMECFLLPEDEVTKEVRYCAKNRFVFPQFYGSWWMDCARDLWQAMDLMGLQTRSGVPLREHLRARGIRELGDQNRDKPRAKRGTFEAHIKDVEHNFWERRFVAYSRWRRDWYTKYQKRGFFVTKTGFVCQGHMSRNDAINYPVQGSAFHCLLQSLVWLNRELAKKGMQSLVIGQIHDSIVADVPERELAQYVALARKLMVDRLRKRWDWITVPLGIEVERSPVNGSWADKEVWDG